MKVPVSIPVSIKDIARIAGVSHSTVSRALHDSPLVNAQVRARIQKLARKHGYEASLAARSLVTRETKSLGCVVTSISDPFMGEVVSGVEAAASRGGYSVLLASSGANPERELQAVRMFAQRRVDGVVSTASRVGEGYRAALAALQIPVVLVNNQRPGGYAHSVAIDNAGAVRCLIQHLIELGHREIAYIGDRTGGSSDRERRMAYSQALRKADLRHGPELVAYGESDAVSGARAMQTLIGLGEWPTAVLAYNDMTALGALAAIREAGLRVPEDISVAGFDDLFFAAYTRPSLTTMRQPMRAMGETAVEVLLDLLRGDKSERAVKLPAELVVRGSTGRVRQRSRRA